MMQHCQHHDHIEMPMSTLQERVAFLIAPADRRRRPCEINHQRKHVEMFRVSPAPDGSRHCWIAIDGHNRRAPFGSEEAKAALVGSHVEYRPWSRQIQSFAHEALLYLELR